MSKREPNYHINNITEYVKLVDFIGMDRHYNVALSFSLSSNIYFLCRWHLSRLVSFQNSSEIIILEWYQVKTQRHHVKAALVGNGYKVYWFVCNSIANRVDRHDAS